MELSPLELKNHYRDKLGKDIWSIITLYLDIKMKYALLLPDFKKPCSYIIRKDFVNIYNERIRILYFCEMIYNLKYDVINIKYFVVPPKNNKNAYMVYKLLININNINLAKKIFNKEKMKIIIDNYFIFNLFSKKEGIIFQFETLHKPIVEFTSLNE